MSNEEFKIGWRVQLYEDRGGVVKGTKGTIIEPYSTTFVTVLWDLTLDSLPEFKLDAASRTDAVRDPRMWLIRIEPFSKAQERKLYKRLPTTCDLSAAALEECAMRMRPSIQYRLWVNKILWTTACMTVRYIGATVQNNPFAPYINLSMLDELEPREWFIEGKDGDAWGSEGV